jgi:hypothetical protein
MRNVEYPIRHARVRRPRLATKLGWASAAFAWAPFVAMVIARFLVRIDKPPGWHEFVLTSFWLALATMFGWTGARWAARRTKSKDAERGAVRVDASDLLITQPGREIRIERADIEGGMVLPSWRHPGDSRRVEIATKGGRVAHIELDAAKDAAALLDELGIDAARRRFVADGNAAMWRAPLGIGGLIGLVWMAVQLVDAGPAAARALSVVWLGLFAGLAALVHFGSRRRVSIGVDGVMIEAPWRSRFVPMVEIRAARGDDRTLVIEREGESEPVRVDIGDTDETLALAQRIGEAKAARDLDALAGSSALPLVERGGRDLPAWRERLRQLVAGASSYRSARLDEGELGELLARTDLSAEQRIGAAIALRARASDAPEKIRIAADACANPKLRIALEHIAGEDDLHEAALEEALRTTSPTHDDPPPRHAP